MQGAESARRAEPPQDDRKSPPPPAPSHDVQGRARFWLAVLIELKNRGVADVCIAGCDGLRGLGEAITTVWERAVVQTCDPPDPQHLPVCLPQVLG